ncbi:hypothetical protein SAMN05192583_0751 [Sphingomonas gellani]|uniref:Uncharacterized protein n=1 Tax=Sphingomonas gellani TaxID=1166340 RepID=A0A1H7ZNP6_9SPHN|nr:hypothetical protein [Sphingomonas gellani]SEM59168.1 hypothetical protein SAMN05192583_0751 [Sphingomonas gellani]
MADQNHVAGGASGGQGDQTDRQNQDPAVPAQSPSGDQDSGAGYGNNAGVQGEELADTEEGDR